MTPSTRHFAINSVVFLQLALDNIFFLCVRMVCAEINNFSEILSAFLPCARKRTISFSRLLKTSEEIGLSYFYYWAQKFLVQYSHHSKIYLPSSLLKETVFSLINLRWETSVGTAMTCLGLLCFVKVKPEDWCNMS